MVLGGRRVLQCICAFSRSDTACVPLLHTFFCQMEYLLLLPSFPFPLLLLVSDWLIPSLACDNLCFKNFQFSENATEMKEQVIYLKGDGFYPMIQNDDCPSVVRLADSRLIVLQKWIADFVQIIVTIWKNL